MSSLPTACDRVVESGLVFVLVFSPLAIGAVHPSSHQVVEVCAFALLGVFALRVWTSASDGVPILPVRLWLPAALLLVRVALIYHARPIRLRNLLWLPFIYLYWSVQNFIALIALTQMVLRRPRRWQRTPKTGTATPTGGAMNKPPSS